MESSPQLVPSGPTPVLNLSGGDILIVPADDPQLSKYYYLVIAVYPLVQEDMGAGAQKIRGPEKYGRREWKGWKEGVLKGRKK